MKNEIRVLGLLNLSSLVESHYIHHVWQLSLDRLQSEPPMCTESKRNMDYGKREQR